MFDAPVDAWYLWLGVAATSVVVLGVAVALPTATSPDAVAAADAVDAVAASPHEARVQRPLRADEMKLGPYRLALRGAGGTAHASFAYGPVTPVRRGTRLEAVLDGRPPERVFETPEAFRRAIVAARSRTPEWHPTGGTVTARRVSWEGVDATLVG